jgi:hypothetical protein
VIDFLSDLLAVGIGFACFAVFIALIEGLDRV